MKKLLLIISFISYSLSIQAHNGQISTISIIQNEDKKWSLMISSGVNTFEYELRNKFPNLNLNTLKINDFQKLFLANLKENISINTDEGNDIELINGSIKIGHQTDARFNLKGMPEKLEGLSIQNQSFSTINDHYCVINIITKKGSSQNFLLKKGNKFKISLTSENGIWKESESHGIGFYALLSTITVFLISIIFIILRKKSNNKV